MLYSKIEVDFMAEKELKPVFFRIDGNVKEKFREIAEATGNNQQETMQLLINAYYMQERKVDLPEHKASIEKFEQCATNMIQMFTDALQTNHDLRESVLQEFSATMDSKDKVIQNLQDQMAELKAAKENAEKTATASAQAAGQALKDLAAAEERAESSSQLAAEKEKTISTLAEKLSSAEEKGKKYDGLYESEKTAQEQIHALERTIKELEKAFSDSDEAICLCGRNKTADQINAAKIAKLPGKARTYQAQIAGDVSAQDKPAPDQLHLKKNVRVIMLQNTDKYRNGSSAIVTSLGNDEITVKIDESDELVTVPYANWDVERYAVDPSTNKVTKEIIGTFRQLPVRPGYAITIHKSQGQSLDKVTLKLGNRWPEIFSCGQLYVALSRATSMDGLYIDGSLEKIKVLASEDFLNFQNNALDTCVNSTNSEEIPVSEEQPEDTTKEPSASDGRTISIKCPAHAAKAIFSFAQALTPDTKLVDSVLILPEEYKQAVKTFIEVIL